MPAITLHSPAKLNLFLAITGRRADGFHDLVSVVTPVRFGDTLDVAVEGAPTTECVLTCTDPAVPTDEANFSVRAFRAFVAATGRSWRCSIRLHKRVPMGAGLGGGSSNGAVTLRALNELTGHPLGAARLQELAAALGSDCPLFLAEGASVMRGRGEQLQPLPPPAAERLRGRRVLIFKPGFGVPTAWAYQWMAARAASGSTVYLAAAEAERRLQAWLDQPGGGAEGLLYNNLEQPAFAKYLAIPTLLEHLQRDFGLAPRMTGSGSACFALLGPDAPVVEITAAIRNAWGAEAFVVDTALA